MIEFRSILVAVATFWILPTACPGEAAQRLAACEGRGMMSSNATSPPPCRASKEPLITAETFRSVYPREVHGLFVKCRELNHGAVETSKCVKTTLETAIDVNRSLPIPGGLSDKNFNVIADERLYEQLLEASTSESR